MTTGFWTEKTLAQMSAEEWEALCDGCGRCCVYPDTGRPCHVLDCTSARCTSYAKRFAANPNCVPVTLHTIPALTQAGALPKTCAYRRLFEGQALPAWHPLISGDPEAAIKARVSVIGRPGPQPIGL